MWFSFNSKYIFVIFIKMLNDMVLLNVLDIMQNERDKKESPDSIEFEFDTSSLIKY